MRTTPPLWFTRKDGKVDKVVAIIRVTGSHVYRKAWVRTEDGYERWVFWNWLTDVEPQDDAFVTDDVGGEKMITR